MYRNEVLSHIDVTLSKAAFRFELIQSQFAQEHQHFELTTAKSEALGESVNLTIVFF